MADPKNTPAAAPPATSPPATPQAAEEQVDVNLSVKFTKKEMKALRLAAINADEKNAGNFVRALVCKSLGLK